MSSAIVGPGRRPSLSAGDRALAWLVTGPLGRLAAFVADLMSAWWRWARRREHPERTR